MATPRATAAKGPSLALLRKRFMILDTHSAITVEGSSNAEFTGDLFRVATDCPAPLGVEYSRAIKLEFEWMHARMALKESILFHGNADSNIHYYLHIPPGSFRIVHIGVTASDAFEICLELNSATLRIGEDDIVQTFDACVPRDKKRELCGFSARQHLLRTKFLRIQIHKASSNKVLTQRMTIIKELFQAGHLPTLQERIEAERKLWVQALEGEIDAAEKELESWGLKNAILKVRPFEKIPVFEIESDHVGAPWQIEDLTTVYIRPGETSNDFFDPGKAIAWKKKQVFVGQVLPQKQGMSRGARHVKLLNDLSPKQFNTLQHIARPEFSTKVNIEAFSDDKMADRFSDALRTFNKTAAYQHGDTSIVVEGSRADIRLLLPRLFVDDPRHHPNAWTSTSFALKNPGASLSFPKQWNTAQRRVFESVLEGRGGVSGCIGPPGTGKTTTIGAIPGEMIKQFKLKRQRIVMCAQSNQATNEIVRKTAAGLTNSGLNPLEILVHVLPSSSRTNKAGSEDAVPRTDIDKFSLWEHCRRIATAYGHRYDAWHKGDAELRKYGKIEDGDLSKRFRYIENIIFEDIKRQCKVFVCTLAAVSSGFFVNDENHQWQVDMLFVDEASQATMVAVLVPIQTLDPYQVFFGGDDNQLPAFCKSERPEIKSIVQNSPIDRTKARGIRFPLLDLEYRMPWNLYLPTSWTFYEKMVDAAVPVGDRAELVARENLAKISVFTGTNWVRLQNTGLVFNVRNGKASKPAGSTSRCNMKEARFVKCLAAALVVAGVSAADIMELTAYQAQYDILLRDNKSSLKGESRVRKIDGSQGGEAEFVIMSSVISDQSANIGMMGERRRINVITSRQRSAFLIVCNYDNLITPFNKPLEVQQKKGYETWRKYFEHFAMAQENALRALKIKDGQWKIDIVSDNFRFKVDGNEVKPADEIEYREATPPATPSDNYSAAAAATSSTSAATTSGAASIDSPAAPPSPSSHPASPSAQQSSAAASLQISTGPPLDSSYENPKEQPQVQMPVAPATERPVEMPGTSFSSPPPPAADPALFPDQGNSLPGSASANDAAADKAGMANFADKQAKRRPKLRQEMETLAALIADSGLHSGQEKMAYEAVAEAFRRIREQEREDDALEED